MSYGQAWNDIKAGVMVRGALWLVQEIGAGNTFTKEDIRRAFPGVSQADRRIRDLRDYGWTLHTSGEDASLAPEQTRFVSPGVAVWDARERRAGNPNKAISSKERDATLARDDYMCTVCGISGAEEYADDPTQTAVIGVSRRIAVLPDGTEKSLIVTECKRCRSGRGSKRLRADRVVSSALALSREDRLRLSKWIRAGRKDLTSAEQVWSLFLLLPNEARDEVRSALEV